MDDDIQKNDNIEKLRSTLANLPTEEKIALSKEAVRSLDPVYRAQFASEFVQFVDTAGEQQARERLVVIAVATIIIIASLVVLTYTMTTSPTSLEYVGGVITTLTGTVAGYIGGRARVKSRSFCNFLQAQCLFYRSMSTTSSACGFSRRCSLSSPISR